jgi:protoporphyrinogen oxidase
MDDHMALDRAVFAEDVHRAPIRDPRHCQPRHTRQGGLVVERGGQHFARLCEEAQARLRALVLGDVMQHRHASDDVSVYCASGRSRNTPTGVTESAPPTMVLPDLSEGQ